MKFASKNWSLSTGRSNSSRASNAADNQVFRDALFDLLKIFSDEKQPTPTKPDRIIGKAWRRKFKKLCKLDITGWL